MILLECAYPDWILKWIDLCKYPLSQLITAGLGELLWSIVYILVIRDAIRLKYVQIPGQIVSLNLAWEFLAAFAFHSIAGKLMNYGFILWFGMDVVIFGLTLRYGQRQVDQGLQEKYFNVIVIGTLFMALTLFYLYFDEGPLEQHYAMAAFMINLIMSAQFLTNLLRLGVSKFMSMKVAWIKMLGTAITTVSVLLSNNPLGVVIAMGIFIFILDIAYIILLKKQKEANRKILVMTKDKETFKKAFAKKIG